MIPEPKVNILWFARRIKKPRKNVKAGQVPVGARTRYLCTAIRTCYRCANLCTGIVNPLAPNDPYMGRTAPLTSKVAFYIFIQQIQVLNILNMVYILRFISSSKCSLFYNPKVFGSCIIHILYTGVLKFKKKKFRHQKVKNRYLG